MKKFRIIILIILISVFIAPVLDVRFVAAVEFDPNEIIANTDLSEYYSMDFGAVKDFLNGQNGVLMNYKGKDAKGIDRTAAEIIYNAANDYKINPKWILATLQKEQSLITNPSPSQYNLDWAMGYAVCDSCSVDDPKVVLFKGFGTQIDRATWRIKYYSDNPHEFNFHPGVPKVIDGQDVTPYNQATANLYNYTPHIHGNYNFWVIWNRWFAKIYPDGSLLTLEGDPGVWLIDNGKRRPFWSKTALTSRYDPTKIITVTKNDLNRYEIGYPIKYPNYSLLEGSDGKVYLTVNNEKKHIESEEVFRTIGFNYEEVIKITDEELSHYEDGRKISLNSIYPQGALLQDDKTGGVYYVEDGIKYPVLAKEMLEHYDNYSLTQVGSDELAKYVTAATGVKFKDGTLMKTATDSRVYVVSNGQRRWLANASTFKQLGYKWISIITVSDKVINLHPLGQDLDLIMSSETKMTIN